MKGQTKLKILLVTPVWRDSQRLTVFGAKLAKTLSACRHDIHWVIADDGSSQSERNDLQLLHQELSQIFPNVSLHFAKEHCGKGAVVREAWSLHPESDLLSFVDADGSLSPDEFVRMLDVAEECDQSVMAIRERTESTHVDLSPFRALAHRLFIIAVRLLVGVKAEDPQCGAKILRGSDYRPVAASLQEDGLAFDAEMLTALSEYGVEWKELPVTWVEKDGGKVKPLRDAWGMLAALWRIRSRQRSGDFIPAQKTI